MPIEKKPLNPAPRLTAPANARRHAVKDNESWESIAAQYGTSAAEIIRFNFGPTTGPEEVNWYLREHVGCSKTFDGKNYAFRTYDKPGIIWIPIKGQHVVVPAVEQRLITYTVSDHYEREYRRADDGDTRAQAVLDLVDWIIQRQFPSCKNVRRPYFSGRPVLGEVRADSVLTRVQVNSLKQHLKPDLTVSYQYDMRTTYSFIYGSGDKSQQVAVSYHRQIIQLNGSKSAESMTKYIPQPASYVDFEKMGIPEF